jgi:mannan endo-1,4-beta-mannosidase
MCTVNCTDVEDVPAIYPEYKDVKELSIVDKNATNETKALYANLWTIQETGFMFGHHDDLWYGRKWYNTEGGSDTKEVCGDYPAVFSVDFATIMDNRFQNGGDITENDIRKRVLIEAYNRGEVILACCHLNNPLTGGDAWDNSSNEVVKEILEDGSATNVKFKQWLDRLAVFVSELKGKNGELIPIIFRPFHEHTQSWSWWGSSCTTQEEFVALWQFTVQYLRDTKGVHQFIYAISPQIDSPGARERVLYRWPGDEYVDFLGIDSYHGLNPATFTANINLLSKISKEMGKPCGITETGVEGIQRDGIPEKNYWTQQILTPASGQFLSMIVLWRNAYDPGEGGSHFYSAYKGHASASDFVKMYQSPMSLFSKDLPDMYKYPENITVK